MRMQWKKEMKTEILRAYQCPGCGYGAERPEGWKGVFCSKECKEDARTVRAMREEIQTGKLTPGTKVLAVLWDEIMRFGMDQRSLPPRAYEVLERVFFPEPVYPADREEWSTEWRSWKKKRTVSEPREHKEPVFVPVEPEQK
ncbi:hypothetical protein [Streptomyces acidiscabies]|uniref:Uncharacterized protein n=1 Tax=Streptomyces acidiscabies TaxID=42234 RepID=A0ABU4MC64_9ACTN|nr:hypothetical protein [Streptomyces acidiscabies]MDX3025708.1 hypothetical protein [Streptomyces acidiscabies]